MIVNTTLGQIRTQSLIESLRPLVNEGVDLDEILGKAGPVLGVKVSRDGSTLIEISITPE